MVLPQVWPLVLPLLCLLSVRADLVPGDQIEFKTKGGFQREKNYVFIHEYFLY